MREREGIDVRVVGIAGRDRTWSNPRGIDLGAWLRGDLSPSAASPPTAWLDAIARWDLGPAVLADCTAASGMEDVYRAAFGRGMSVVTANKNPMVIPMEARRALFAAARETGRSLFYETTVGADLPVIAHLADRVRSGDVVLDIEGSLSGTLGFLSDAVSRGVGLVEAVKDAAARGYTEPDPCEDLSGRDVARKALILARELGLPLELDDVVLEPFVPQTVLDRAADPQIGLERALGEAAPLFAARTDRLRKEDRVIRYLAQIVPKSDQPLRVGPIVVGADHPASQLRGTEAMVALTTERAGDVRVVIRGPGAGGAATASGVLADILRT